MDVGGGEERAHGERRNLLAPVAQQVHHGLVHVQEAPREVQEEHAVARPVEQGPVPFLSFPQRLFRPLALGDVAGDALGTDEIFDPDIAGLIKPLRFQQENGLLRRDAGPDLEMPMPDILWHQAYLEGSRFSVARSSFVDFI
jgi:hypothetical protein